MPLSPSIFSGVHVTRSLFLCICFVDHCLSFCTFSFGHCVVCSSIYGFWLPLWYLQTLLKLYCGSQFSWWRKLEYLEETTTLADKLNHIMLYRVHLAMSGLRTPNVSGDSHWLYRCKSNYHTITTTTATIIFILIINFARET